MSEATIGTTPPRPRPHVMSDAEARLYETTGDGSVPSVPVAVGASEPQSRKVLPIEREMKKSGLRQHFLVEMDDGTMHDVQTTIQDTLRYEKTHARRAAEADAMPVTRLLFLAWAALKRTGVEDVGTFPEFQAHIAELHIEDEDDGDVDPTEREAGEE